MDGVPPGTVLVRDERTGTDEYVHVATVVGRFAAPRCGTPDYLVRSYAGELHRVAAANMQSCQEVCAATARRDCTPPDCRLARCFLALALAPSPPTRLTDPLLCVDGVAAQLVDEFETSDLPFCPMERDASPYGTATHLMRRVVGGARVPCCPFYGCSPAGDILQSKWIEANEARYECDCTASREHPQRAMVLCRRCGDGEQMEAAAEEEAAADEAAVAGAIDTEVEFGRTMQKDKSYARLLDEQPYAKLSEPRQQLASASSPPQQPVPPYAKEPTSREAAYFAIHHYYPSTDDSTDDDGAEAAAADEAEAGEAERALAAAATEVQRRHAKNLRFVRDVRILEAVLETEDFYSLSVQFKGSVGMLHTRGVTLGVELTTDDFRWAEQRMPSFCAAFAVWLSNGNLLPGCRRPVQALVATATAASAIEYGAQCPFAAQIAAPTNAPAGPRDESTVPASKGRDVRLHAFGAQGEPPKPIAQT